MVSSKDYYKKITHKWKNEYPSSQDINEVWSFYKECGYTNPQQTLKNIMDKVFWKKKKVLDLGCDNGLMLKIICDWYPVITGVGVDINSIAIAKAQQLFSDFTFDTFDGVNLPYEDKSFDLIFISAVVKHIRYEDRENFYKEINRVADNVFIIEADSKIKEQVSHHSWILYHSNFEEEFKQYFKPIEVIYESGDLLGLYRCKAS
jgi:SAM-dependent methyltransferase